MGRSAVQKQIDREVYDLTPLPASIGLPIGHRLLKEFGPVLAKVTQALGAETKSEIRDIAQAIAADPEGAKPEIDTKLADFFTKIVEGVGQVDTALIIELSQTFAQYTKFRAGALMLPLADHFDDHFAQRYGLLVKWVYAHVRLNFGGDFFRNSASSGSAKATASETQSQSTSAAPTA